MKKMICTFVVVLASSISFTSCSSSDDTIDPNSIVGKWDAFQLGSLVEGQEVYQEYPFIEGCDKDYIEFTNDRLLREVFYEENCLEQVLTSNYATNGNALVVSYGGQTQTYIYTISGDVLKIRRTLTLDQEGEMLATEEEGIQIIKFKRK